MKFIFLDIVYVYTITIKEKLGMSYHSPPPMPCTSFLRCSSCLGEYGLNTLEVLSLPIYQISRRDFHNEGELSQPKTNEHDKKIKQHHHEHHPSIMEHHVHVIVYVN
jgi:hypothetical protein